ncbi:hypothetical protein CEW46_23890 [Bacillus cereus]|nr:hypothetical protein CEW46_23890 [Bacillus cereus]
MYELITQLSTLPNHIVVSRQVKDTYNKLREGDDFKSDFRLGLCLYNSELNCRTDLVVQIIDDELELLKFEIKSPDENQYVPYIEQLKSIVDFNFKITEDTYRVDHVKKLERDKDIELFDKFVASAKGEK